jgi:hypothetical protein
MEQMGLKQKDLESLHRRQGDILKGAKWQAKSNRHDDKKLA